MHTTSSLSELVRQARSGKDPEAARRIVEHFEPELRTLIRRHLPKSIKRYFDTGDALQDVMKSFLLVGKSPEGVDEIDNVKSYLFQMVKNRIMEEKRKLMQTRKYDLKRVLPLTLDGEGESADYQLTSDDPSPSRPVLEDEAWKQLSSGLSSDEVELIERRREGATYKELAALRKCNVKTIQRFFDKLREERGLS